MNYLRTRILDLIQKNRLSLFTFDDLVEKTGCTVFSQTLRRELNYLISEGKISSCYTQDRYSHIADRKLRNKTKEELDDFVYGSNLAILLFKNDKEGKFGMAWYKEKNIWTYEFKDNQEDPGRPIWQKKI